MLSPIQKNLCTLVNCIEKNDLAKAVTELKLVVEAKKNLAKTKSVAKAFHQNKVIGAGYKK